MKPPSPFPLYYTLLASTFVLGAPRQSSTGISSWNERRREDMSECDNVRDFFAEKTTIGNANGGNGPYCAAKWSHGILPTEMEARADDRTLRWLAIRFTDGSVKTYGDEPGVDLHRRVGKVTWNPWIDTFTSFDVWGGGWDNGVGRFFPRLSSCPRDSCEMDVGGYNKEDGKVDIPRGASRDGVLLGFSIKAGKGIDSLTPIFSDSAIERVILRDATFDPSFEQLNERPFSERMMQVLQATHTLNNTKSSSAATLWVDSSIGAEEQHRTSEIKEDGSEHGAEGGVTVKGETSWKVGVPELANAERKFGVEVAAKYVGKRVQKSIKGDENTKITKVGVRYRVSHEVPAGAMVRCTTTVIQSRVDIKFLATLENRFKSGKSFEYKVTGRLEDANHSEAYTECHDIDPNPPAGEDPSGSQQGSEQGGSNPTGPSNPNLGVVISESGTYCPGGTKVSDGEMSDGDYFAACGL